MNPSAMKMAKVITTAGVPGMLPIRNPAAYRIPKDQGGCLPEFSVESFSTDPVPEDGCKCHHEDDNPHDDGNEIR